MKRNCRTWWWVGDFSPTSQEVTWSAVTSKNEAAIKKNDCSFNVRSLYWLSRLGLIYIHMLGVKWGAEIFQLHGSVCDNVRWVTPIKGEMYCFRFISALSVTIARFRVFYCTQYCFFFSHLSGKQILLQQKHPDTNCGVPFLRLRADVSELNNHELEPTASVHVCQGGLCVRLVFCCRGGGSEARRVTGSTRLQRIKGADSARQQRAVKDEITVSFCPTCSILLVWWIPLTPSMLFLESAKPL